MRKIVDVILEKETLEGDEFRKLLNELIPDIPEKYNLLDQKAQIPQHKNFVDSKFTGGSHGFQI